MNREIKFRALRDDMGDCSFVYGCLIYSKDGHPRILTGRDERGWALFTTCSKGTEGQFTGLKDRNGNEIYEGDIMTMRKHSDGNALVVTMVNGAWHAGDWGPLADAIHYADFFGNIHQNPELLKS